MVQVSATNEKNDNSYFLTISNSNLCTIFDFLNFDELKIFTNHICHKFRNNLTTKFEVRKYDANSFEFIPLLQNKQSLSSCYIIFPKYVLHSFRIYNPRFQRLVQIFFFASNTFRCDINHKTFSIKNLQCYTNFDHVPFEEYTQLTNNLNWTKNIKSFFWMGAKQPITIWLTNHYIISFWVVNLLLPNGSHNRLFEFDKNVAIFPLGQEGFFEINTLKCGGKKIKKLFKISNVFEIDENFEIDDDNDDENDHENFFVFKKTEEKLISIEGKNVKDFILDEKNHRGKIIYENSENKTDTENLKN